MHNREAGRFFGWFARRYRKRFGRKGLEPSQKQLVEGLSRAGVARETLLEIGCGVGYLHQRLLEDGAASATGIDLSSRMLEEARAAAAEKGLAGRTDYREGDFVELADSLAPADAVILDKVICCYPDGEALAERAARQATHTLAYTIPRDRWSVRLGMGFGSAMLKLLRCGFRSYVHDPAAVERSVSAAGFERIYENVTFMWLTRVYARRAEPRA